MRESSGIFVTLDQIIVVNLLLQSAGAGNFDLNVDLDEKFARPGSTRRWPVCPSNAAVLIFTSVPKARRDQVCPQSFGSGDRISGKVLLA
jgi:hypothetical protein